MIVRGCLGRRGARRTVGVPASVRRLHPAGASRPNRAQKVSLGVVRVAQPAPHVDGTSSCLSRSCAHRTCDCIHQQPLKRFNWARARSPPIAARRRSWSPIDRWMRPGEPSAGTVPRIVMGFDKTGCSAHSVSFGAKRGGTDCPGTIGTRRARDADAASPLRTVGNGVDSGEAFAGHDSVAGQQPQAAPGQEPLHRLRRRLRRGAEGPW